ncbi:MAG TPA: ABC transporter substrate-binding protein [Candidatus Dormibacteraeota bacterium]|jgi:NitT/TauT family transport system substrate-binding protein|nr:ABC transporter substrate-binding protein [Candidatus Dormibacteraeota bacterium]
MPTPARLRRVLLVLLAAVATGGLAACGGAQATGSGSGSPAPEGPVTLRLGYFPNLTHAVAMVGVEKGYLTQALGSTVTLKTQTFNAGPAAVEAIFGGALDIAYVGPNPAINAYSKSKGSLVRIVAGAASGGAALVVRKAAGITSAEQLRGRKLASPQLGNTQDVALRSYLAAHGIHVDAQGGGDATITSTDNATILQLFKAGSIDAAWMPEPWVTRLVSEAAGAVLVDERSLWPNGQFPTTEVLVTTQFLNAHPLTVQHFLEGHLASLQWLQANPAAGQSAVNDALLKLTQKKLDTTELATAWQNLQFTLDPLPAALAKQAAAAHDAGLVASTDLHGIMDLRILNSVLRSKGLATFSSGGYGSQ